MKRLLIALLMLMPLIATAQDNTWERIETEPVQKDNPDAKYLIPNAVPEIDGKVCWEQTIEAPGKSAKEIYDILLAQLTKMTEEEIVREACRHKPRHIVITGGEPALQLTQSLVDKLHEAGFFIQVETNGTLSLPEGIDWVTVSPKKASPVPSQGGVNAPSLLERVGVRPHELKVLYMGKDTDPDTILKSLPLGGEGGGPRLYLQPLDTGNTERNRIILRETIDYIMQHPKWSLSLQTHKLLGIK